MQNQHFKRLSQAAPMVVLLMLCLSAGCSGQEPKKPNAEMTTVKDSTAQRTPLPKTAPPQKPEPPKVGAAVSYDPKKPSGYVFMDAQGKEVNFIAQKDLYNRNPYNKINLGLARQGDTPGSFQSYTIKNLSAEEIKKGLPKTLTSIPKEGVIKKIGLINTYLINVDCNWDDPRFMIVSYALVMYDKESLAQEWVETTIHVYDNKGRLISTIVDHHNILGAFISPDGKYILANEILDRFGDGTSEAPIGLVIYDVTKGIFMATLKNRFMDYDHHVNVKDGKFNFYGAFAKNYVIDGGNDDFVSMKFIIDPRNRILYQKPYKVGPSSHDRPIFNSKSSAYPNGEDLSTYEVLRF